MSPYVVTTKRPTVGYDVTVGQEPIIERGEVVSRRAVATLGEARWIAHYQTLGVEFARRGSLPDPRFDSFYDSTLLPESGGTVGPLPDGTVIEVERVKWETLAGDFETRERMAERGSWSQESLIAAFNAQEATR